jgi:arylsulfate sulfotransferase
MPRKVTASRAKKRPASRRGSLLAVAAICWASTCARAAISVTLEPSVPSPANVGTIVTWTASVSDSDPGIAWYRFRVRRVGFEFRVIKDYGLENTLDWTATDHEGSFEIEVSIRNTATGAVATARAPYVMLSNVTGNEAAVLPTSHPLVFLYSAPACDPQSRMRVEFQPDGGLMQNTPYQPCRAGLSMNFYLAGLLPETEYLVRHTVDTGSAFIEGPMHSFVSGPLLADLPDRKVVKPPPAAAPNRVLLQDVLFTNPFATDLNGNVVWYYPGTPSFLTRPEPGGYFFGIVQDPNGDPALQLLLEFDLTGMTVLQTNAARVNEQLAELGKRRINSFHHEARRLPDGKVLVLAGLEQILNNVQGSGPVDVLGDMIIVLDRSLKVVWTWDAFDHLDPARRATLDDICAPGVCPPLRLARAANDWTHAKSVQQTPDGNLLLSVRSQDWILKIDYENGEGGGEVIWRLGKDGDFRMISADPNPWFSHQHDPHFLADNKTLLLFDNGNFRRDTDANANSRGQVIQVDERNRTATLAFNQNLGQYSFALGSANILPNGDYHFDNGFLPDTSAMSMEFDPSGNLVYALQTRGPAYRSFRMRDLYSPQ